MEAVQFDREKFREAIYFICANAKPDELGRVKLHKILYFADMLKFASSGSPLTGVEYQKQPFGPTARHLGAALAELEHDGAIRVQRRDFFGFEKDDFLVVRSMDVVRLSGSEQDLLMRVIDFVCAKSAKEISELSHNAAWNTAELGETLPYFTAWLLAPTDVTDDDVEWAEEEAVHISTQRIPSMVNVPRRNS